MLIFLFFNLHENIQANSMTFESIESRCIYKIHMQDDRLWHIHRVGYSV